MADTKKPNFPDTKGMDLKQFLDINWFKEQSTLADNLGLPLANRFVCLLNAPKFEPFLANGWLELQVIAVDCPNISIDSSEVELNGSKRFYFRGRGDGDLTITFLETPDLTLRRFFYEWIKQAVDVRPGGSVVRNYMDTYAASEMMVAPLDYSGRAWHGDKFIKVFPTNVHDISYNYGSSNEIIKTLVTFKYVLHQIVDVTSQKDGYHFTTTSNRNNREMLWSK